MIYNKTFYRLYLARLGDPGLPVHSDSSAQLHTCSEYVHSIARELGTFDQLLTGVRTDLQQQFTVVTHKCYMTEVWGTVGARELVTDVDAKVINGIELK